MSDASTSRPHGAQRPDRDIAEPIVRRAVAADLPEIVALLADDDLGRTREIVSDPVDPCYAAAFARIDGDPDDVLIVATTGDGRVIGTLQFTVLTHLARRGARRGQIEGVRVASGARGRGVGAKMVLWAIAEARSRGCSLVQLTTDQARAGAHDFYRKLGFSPSHVGFKLVL